MADAMIVYKCPDCGAEIKYDITEGKLICKYCDAEFDASELQSYDKDVKGKKPEDFEWRKFKEGENDENWEPDDLTKLTTFECSHCGGKIIGEGTTMATLCPYCDNPVVMSGSIDGLLCPDYIIPFKKTREDVAQAFADYMKGKYLLPSKFKKRNKPENIRGVYVPFWMFNCKTYAKAEISASNIDRVYDEEYGLVTYTRKFHVKRMGRIDFKNIPIDSSTKMDDAFMETIEPYDNSEAVKFSSAYLAGFAADRYDVEYEKCVERANQRIRSSVSDILRSTADRYDNVSVDNLEIEINDGNTSYTLAPVYMMNTNYLGKKYTLAMNGQTGKIVGELPTDYFKLVRWLVLTGIISFLLFWLLFGSI